MKNPISPRKVPAQSRALATQQAILQASARILSEQGLSVFNTNRVAQLAGISVGSLYQYYPNKAALLAALNLMQHQILLTNLDLAIARCAKLSLKATLPKLVAVAMAHQFEDPRLAAALDYAERELPPHPGLLPLRQLLLASLQTALSQHRADIKGDLKTIALDVQVIVQAMVDGAALRGESLTPALKKRVNRAVSGYVMGDI